MNKNTGITLIALVITIILLLILAGCSISLLTGENGILNRTIEAKVQTQKASELENLKLEILESLDDSGKISIEKLQKNLNEKNIEYSNGDEFPIRINMENNDYVITKNGEIIENIVKYNKNGLMVCLDATHNTYEGYNENTNIWYDLSGNENNAILSNFENNDVSGWNNGSLKVKGNTTDEITSNEFVKIPYGLQENESFSLEMVFEDNDDVRTTYLSADTEWHTFRFHDYKNSDGVYDGRFYIGGNIYSDNNYNFYNRFEPNDTGYLLKPNNIYYIAYTYESGTNKATLYINGTKNSYTKNYIGNNEACSYFMVRALEDDDFKSGSATYHQIRFYNRVLSYEEVESNFNIDCSKYNIHNN